MWEIDLPKRKKYKKVVKVELGKKNLY